MSHKNTLFLVALTAAITYLLVAILQPRLTPIIAQPQSETLRFEQELDANIEHKVLYSQSELELYIHKAFIDDRFNRTMLRIFALEMKDAVKVDFVCRWKHRSGEATMESRAHKYTIDKSWPDWSPYFATNYDCVFPPFALPTTVQLVSSDGRFKFNGIPVEGQATKEKRAKRLELGVCVKPITGNFKVARFIEWVEIQRLAGIEHFIIYITDLVGPARFVFRYYEQMGLVSVVDFPYMTAVLQKVDRHGYTGPQRYGMYQQIYLVAMHDCLYRFRRYFRHLAFVDVDEVILPHRNETIADVLVRAEKTYPEAAGYMFLTAWHLEEFSSTVKPPPQPDYVYMLQYATATFPIDNQPKSIMITERVITINFHSVLDVADKKYANMIVAWDEFGYTHHFRGRCDDKFENWRCQKMGSNVRIDPVVSRYEVALKSRVSAVLEHLQMV